jgi:aspartate-semialdehyde dehydrogenase
LSKNYNVAILGATGAVGTELLALLEERNFPLGNLKLLASERSAGQSIKFAGRELIIESVTETSFDGVDIVLASAGGSISKKWLPIATKAGAVSIDNSSAFRMHPDVPLIVPEVNPESAHYHKGIIANPNCTTILMAVAIYPLHQVQPILNGEPAVPEILPYPLAFNLFPHNSPMTDNAYCEEEMKMVNETRKIFGDYDIRITATCVRVPVLRAHSEAINLEFAHPFNPDRAREILAKADGVKVVEDFSKNYFPMPIDASGKDDVLVGRIRQDISHPNGLELWLCGDQIRKGAALNAVQIAELLIVKDLI